MLRRKKTLVIFCVLFFIVTPAVTYAEMAASGLKVCGGNHAQRLGGATHHLTGYCMRNFDFNETINIVSVRIVDGNGNELFKGLPTADPDFKSTLTPTQSTCFGAPWVLGEPLPRSDQPIQTYIYWETDSGRRAESLGAGGSRIVRDAATGAEISRKAIFCRDLKWKN